MRFEEVQKAEAEFNEAKRKFDEIQNAYLASRGYEMVVDYDRGLIGWKKNKIDTQSTISRSEAIAWASSDERDERRNAEKQIAKLKAEHGIEEAK